MWLMALSVTLLILYVHDCVRNVCSTKLERNSKALSSGRMKPRGSTTKYIMVQRGRRVFGVVQQMAGATTNRKTDTNENS